MRSFSLFFKTTSPKMSLYSGENIVGSVRSNVSGWMGGWRGKWMDKLVLQLFQEYFSHIELIEK